ncbi:MAG: hypothetical protein ACK560_07095 [Bacteroidota bacterium]|jgi:hypothetical protein
MKIFLTLCLVITFASCEQPPLDEGKCITLVEAHMKEASAQNYDAVLEMYDPSFLESEPADLKIEKLKKLYEALGPVEDFDFINATDIKEIGVPRQMKVEYGVRHAKASTIETFVVVEAEGGYKIAGYYVEVS